MPRAVRFDKCGGIDVLYVAEVVTPGSEQVPVRMKAAGTNSGEAETWKGLSDSVQPATFPSRQGSDLPGVVEELGEGVDNLAVGDEVISYVDTRSSQTEFVVAKAKSLVPRPSDVSWEAGGALAVVGRTAYAAAHTVSVGEGDSVVASAAAGGVGSTAVQLAKHKGTSKRHEANHSWLTDHGVVPVTCSDA